MNPCVSPHFFIIKINNKRERKNELMSNRTNERMNENKQAWKAHKNVLQNKAGAEEKSCISVYT